MRFTRLVAVVDDDPGAQFDCLVSDIRMPGIDGFELGRRTAAIAPGLPVIFVSSFNDELTKARAKRAGGAAFMAKPLDAEAFHALLSDALGQS